MWKSLQNEIGFRIRRSLPDWRKKPYTEKLQAPVEQDDLPGPVVQGYSNNTLPSVLFYSWLLKQIPFVLKRETQPAKVVDIGSKNFFYASALYFWARSFFGEHELTGLEIDPYRTYVNLYKRGDYARYYVSLLRDAEAPCRSVRYESGDWVDWEPEASFDLVTSFFPFITPRLHDDWGIPRSSYRPQEYYEKVFRQSRYAIFFHQGDREFAISQELIERINLGKLLFAERFQKNPWVSRKHPVWVLLWAKEETKAF